MSQPESSAVKNKVYVINPTNINSIDPNHVLITKNKEKGLVRVSNKGKNIVISSGTTKAKDKRPKGKVIQISNQIHRKVDNLNNIGCWKPSTSAPIDLQDDASSKSKFSDILHEQKYILKKAITTTTPQDNVQENTQRETQSTGSDMNITYSTIEDNDANNIDIPIIKKETEQHYENVQGQNEIPRKLEETGEKHENSQHVMVDLIDSKETTGSELKSTAQTYEVSNIQHAHKNMKIIKIIAPQNIKITSPENMHITQNAQNTDIITGVNYIHATHDVSLLKNSTNNKYDKSKEHENLNATSFQNMDKKTRHDPPKSLIKPPQSSKKYVVLSKTPCKRKYEGHATIINENVEMINEKALPGPIIKRRMSSKTVKVLDTVTFTQAEKPYLFLAEEKDKSVTKSILKNRSYTKMIGTADNLLIHAPNPAKDLQAHTLAIGNSKVTKNSTETIIYDSSSYMLSGIKPGMVISHGYDRSADRVITKMEITKPESNIVLSRANSDHIVKAIGQTNYEKVMNGLLQVPSQHSKVQAILALLTKPTVPTRGDDKMCQTNESALRQINDTKLKLLKRTKYKKKMPYVVTDKHTKVLEIGKKMNEELNKKRKEMEILMREQLLNVNDESENILSDIENSDDCDESGSVGHFSSLTDFTANSETLNNELKKINYNINQVTKTDEPITVPNLTGQNLFASVDEKKTNVTKLNGYEQVFLNSVQSSICASRLPLKQTIINIGMAAKTFDRKLGQTPPNTGQISLNLSQTSSNLGHAQPNIGQSSSNFGQTQANLGEIAPTFSQNPRNEGHTTAVKTLSKLILNPSSFGQSQVNIGQNQPNIGQNQPKIGQNQLNVGQIQPNVGQNQINVGQIQPNVGQNQINVGQIQPNVGQNKINVGQIQPNVGQNKINVGQIQPNVGQNQINVGQIQPNVGQNQINVGQIQRSIGQHQINVGQNLPNTGQTQLNIGQNTVNTGMPTMHNQPNTSQTIENSYQNQAYIGQHQPNIGQNQLNVGQIQPTVGQNQINTVQTQLNIGQNTVNTGHTIPTVYNQPKTSQTIENSNQNQSNSNSNGYEITMSDGYKIWVPVKQEDDFHIATPENIKALDRQDQRKLILHQAYIDFKYALTMDEDGNYPIHRAVLANDLDWLKRQFCALRMKGKTVDVLCGEGLTALEMSLYADTSTCCTTLLQLGADPLMTNQEEGRTLLHFAAEMGADYLSDVIHACVTHARAIISHHVAKLQEGDWSSKTDEELGFALMKHLNTRVDDQGYTPLMLASKMGLYQNVRMLLECQRYPQLTVDHEMPNCGNTALYVAISAVNTDCQENSNMAVIADNFSKTIEYLIEYGADLDKANFSGFSPNSSAQDMNINGLNALLSRLNAKKHSLIIVDEDNKKNILSQDSLMIVKKSNNLPLKTTIDMVPRIRSAKIPANCVQDCLKLYTKDNTGESSQNAQGNSCPENKTQNVICSNVADQNTAKVPIPLLAYPAWRDRILPKTYSINTKREKSNAKKFIIIEEANETGKSKKLKIFNKSLTSFNTINLLDNCETSSSNTESHLTVAGQKRKSSDETCVKKSKSCTNPSTSHEPS